MCDQAKHAAKKFEIDLKKEITKHTYLSINITSHNNEKIDVKRRNVRYSLLYFSKLNLNDLLKLCIVVRLTAKATRNANATGIPIKRRESYRFAT